MAIEMLVNPSHLLPNKPETWDKLEQILRIFQRCGLMDKELPATGEHLTAEGCWQPVTSPDPGVPRMRVSKSLAIKLLKIAIKDLREVQTELGWWRVTWNTLFRRGERTVWRPHRRSRYRQTFRDGVWVAELLIAVRCKLHEHEADLDRHWYLKPDGMALRRRERMSIDRMLAKATRITSFIADDPAFIDAVLKDPHGEWWNALTAKKDAKRKKSPKTDKDTLTWPRSRSGKRSQDRARWWPGQKRTASWQAAYNTACVYAALADAALAAKTEAEQIMATAEIAAAAATDEEVLAAGGLAEQALAEEIRATATNPEEVIVAEVLADEAWAAESQAVALAGMAVRARRHGAQAERQKAAASERMTELAEALPELERRIIASLRRAVENPSSELERPSDWIDTDPDFRFMCQYEKEFADFKQFRDDLKQQDYPLPPAECPVHAGAASAPAAQEGQHAVVSPMECPSPTWAMTRDQENHAPVLMTKKEPPAVTSPHHGTGLL